MRLINKDNEEDRLLPRFAWRRLRYWLWLALVVLTLTGCSTFDDRVWLNAPGWQRAIHVGDTMVLDPVPVTISDDGTLYLLLLDETAGELRLQVTALNRQAEVVWERGLETPQNRLDAPRVVWDGTQLRLFWLSAGSLMTATMDQAGNVTGEARLLSGETVVDDYDVALNPRGQTAVFYAGPRREPGLYAVVADGEWRDPVLLDELGIEPRLQFDDASGLHAVWAHHPPGENRSTFYYAPYRDGQIAPGQEQVAVEVSVGLTSNLQGPFFGIEDDTAYIFWTVEVRTGQQAGTVETSYVTFALDEPQAVSDAALLFVPADYDLPYRSVSNAPLQAGERVPLPVDGGRAVPVQLEANPLPAQELVIAAEANVNYQLRKRASQATLLFLEDGSPQEYQLLSFTRTATAAPYVTSDQAGYLYATWLERGEETGFRVYLAATAPDLLQSLSIVTGSDLAQMAIETIFGLLSGAVLSPFAAILWLIAPLIVLGVTSFMRSETEELISVGSAISVILALATYWTVKQLTLPGTDQYVPFSAWIPILPSWLELPLRWGVPLLIFIVSLALAWHFTYRRKSQSALYFILIYAAVDSVLSMAVFGSIIYGFI